MYSYNILLLGDPNCGKTSLMNLLYGGKFSLYGDEETGMSLTINTNVGEVILDISISINKMPDLVLEMRDVLIGRSFNVPSHLSHLPRIVAWNKVDTGPHSVPTGTTTEVGISCKSGYGVDRLIHLILQTILHPGIMIDVKSLSWIRREAAETRCVEIDQLILTYQKQIDLLREEKKRLFQ